MANAEEPVESLKKHGLELARSNRLEEAKSVLARFVGQCPEDAEAWCVLSGVNGQLGRIDEAETCCLRALALQPDYSEAHMNMGNVLLAKGRYDESLTHFQTVLRLDPKNPVAFWNLGNAQFALGKYDEAATNYLAALDLNPLFVQAHFNLANLRDMQQRFGEAETGYREALKLNPGFAGAWHNLGVVLSKQGRDSEAESAYREAIKLNPTYAFAQNSLAHLLHKLGRRSEAEAAYREALRLMPKFYEAWNNLGSLLMELNRLDEAERAFREALRLNPNNAEVYANLGSVLTAKGRALGLEREDGALAFDEALTNFRRAQALIPNYEVAVVGEATILERQGKFEEAYSKLEPNLEIGGMGVALSFASLCRHLRRCKEAIALLQRVLDRDGPHVDVDDRIKARFKLGQLLDNESKYDEAFEQYHLANELARSIRPFDLKSYVQRSEAIMATCSKDFMARAPRATQVSERPIFIVGMYRSGTTLVEQILSSHPAVFGAGELDQIISIAMALQAETSTPYPHCLESLTPEICSSLAQRYLDFIDSLAPPQAQRVTDKMPTNFLHLGFISLLFPGAHIIHCVRDPLDTCLSNYFQSFGDSLSFTHEFTDLGGYYTAYHRLMAHWRTVLDSPWLEVRYEDLVADQEQVSRKIVEYCGLQWDERCLQFYEARRMVNTASYDQVRQPLYNRSVGRWRNYERHLGPLRQALRDVLADDKNSGEH